MQTAGIEQARERLASAQDAIQSMQRAGLNLAAFASAWTQFLMAANIVYSKLEQGSKRNDKSEAWYGRVKRERKDDPLLAYLHHPRINAEHTLENINREGRNRLCTFPRHDYPG